MSMLLLLLFSLEFPPSLIRKLIDSKNQPLDKTEDKKEEKKQRHESRILLILLTTNRNGCSSMK